MTLPRVWFVTGASSGFGRAVTEAVLACGDAVAAAVRTPASLSDLTQKYPPSKLLVVKCDVINKDDIKSAFDQTYQHFGYCDVVFNNAGLMMFAEVENEAQESLARNLFEVNFWAAANVNVEAVRSFRERNPTERKGGVLLVNSSLTGFVGWAGLGYYAASKHALEGLTESLALELDPSWNIKLAILEPSGFATRPFTEGTMPMLEAHAAYGGEHLATQQGRAWFKGGPGQWGDVNKAAKKIIELSELEKLPLRWVMGTQSIQCIKDKIDRAKKDVEDFERWSDELPLEGGDTVGLQKGKL
ncbi:hypothetical protein ONZ45_g7684 [Pleurotus djamor]|nr:hypothetical protein ONZ45_g7684 [Pleurotus djamor]